nr:Ankyrin repeat domain containing protein [Pandoravirus aubagnensis]
MDQRAQRVSAPIMLAPPEILSCVLDLVSARDFCAARKAHRVFWVTSDRAIERRRERLWLRTSPERACAAGRTDVVEFLWRRKRIPRTFDMWPAALATGDATLLRIAIQQDSSKAKLDSAACDVMRKDAVNMFIQLLDHSTVSTEANIETAIRYCATRILTFVLDAPTRAVPRRWARLSAAHGHVDGLRILLERYPWIPLGSVVDGAIAHLSNPVPVLCLVHERDPLFPWQRVLPKAAQARSVCVMEFLCCRLVLQEAHLHAAMIEASRHGYVDIVKLLCHQPAAQHVDLQPAMLEAAKGGHCDIVKLLCHQETTQGIDLQPVLVVAAEYGHCDVVELLCHQPQAQPADLQPVMLEAAKRGHCDVVKLLCCQPAAQRVDLQPVVLEAAKRGHCDVVQLLWHQETMQGVDLQAFLIVAAEHGRRDIVDFLSRRCPSLALQEAANVADTSTRGKALWAILDWYDKRTDPQASAFCPDEPLLSLCAPLKRAAARGQFKRVVGIICRADESQIDLEAALAVAASPRVAEFLAKRMPARDTPPADPVSFDHWKFAID